MKGKPRIFAAMEMEEQDGGARAGRSVRRSGAASPAAANRNSSTTISSLNHVPYQQQQLNHVLTKQHTSGGDPGQQHQAHPVPVAGQNQLQPPHLQHQHQHPALPAPAPPRPSCCRRQKSSTPRGVVFDSLPAARGAGLRICVCGRPTALRGGNLSHAPPHLHLCPHTCSPPSPCPACRVQTARARLPRRGRGAAPAQRRHRAPRASSLSPQGHPASAQAKQAPRAAGCGVTAPLSPTARPRRSPVRRTGHIHHA